MTNSKDYQEWLKNRGIPIMNGLCEVALKRDDALHAIELLLQNLIPVLGGDVYFRQNSKITIAYANWYCEPKAGEDAKDFSFRSCEKATEYIKQFPNQVGKEALFVLVAKEVNSTSQP